MPAAADAAPALKVTVIVAPSMKRSVILPATLFVKRHVTPSVLHINVTLTIVTVQHLAVHVTGYLIMRYKVIAQGLRVVLVQKALPSKKKLAAAISEMFVNIIMQTIQLEQKPVILAMRHAKIVLKTVPPHVMMIVTPHVVSSHIREHVQAHGRPTVIEVFQETQMPILVHMAHGRPGLTSRRVQPLQTHVEIQSSAKLSAPVVAQTIQAGQMFPRVQPPQTHVVRHEIAEQWTLVPVALMANGKLSLLALKKVIHAVRHGIVNKKGAVTVIRIAAGQTLKIVQSNLVLATAQALKKQIVKP